MNILVVDDDKEIVESISLFLMGEGYKVFKAYNGLDALDMLNENEVHLYHVKPARIYTGTNGTFNFAGAIEDDIVIKLR